MQTRAGEWKGPAVTLVEMLDARERRAARQLALMAALRVPVVTMTVVMPGPVKDSALSRSVLDAATTAVEALFAARSWRVRRIERSNGTTGPEALCAVEADPLTAKTALIDLEETHPLGRLWDLDVICPARGPVVRRTLGRPARRCLVCEAEAHACARSQRHGLGELLAVIEGKVDAYRRSSPG